MDDTLPVVDTSTPASAASLYLSKTQTSSGNTPSGGDAVASMLAHTNGAHMLMPLNGVHVNGGAAPDNDQLVTALQLLSVAYQEPMLPVNGGGLPHAALPSALDAPDVASAAAMAPPPGMGGGGGCEPAPARRPPRKQESKIDVNAAHRAAASALAGLDLTTAKLNLDASKAAVSKDRADAAAAGEDSAAAGSAPVAAKPRPPPTRGASSASLRSSSSRNLGTSARSVRFGEDVLEDMRSRRSADALEGRPSGVGGGMGAVGAAAAAAAARQRRPVTRSISLPFVMQGRGGVPLRMTPAQAQGVALQQQVQLMQAQAGAAGLHPLALQQQLHAAEVAAQQQALALWQQQQQQHQHQQAQQHQQQQLVAQYGLDGAALLQLQQQEQLAALAGGQWGAAVGGGAQGMAPPPASSALWAAGASSPSALQQQRRLPQRSVSTSYLQPRTQALHQQQHQQQHLAGLGRMHAMGGGGGAGRAGSGHLPDVSLMGGPLQGGPPASAAMLASMATLGMPSVTGAGGALPLHALPEGPDEADAAATVSGAAAAGAQLLERYTSSSWTALGLVQQAASDAVHGPRVRDQLRAETALILAAVGVVGRAATPSAPASSAEAAAELTYLAAVAQQHVSVYGHVSMPCGVAAQLLAAVVRVLLHPVAQLGSTGPGEAAVRMLSALTAGNPEVQAAVSQVAIPALSLTSPESEIHRVRQVPSAEVWLSGLAAVANRNAQLLEAMAAAVGPAAPPGGGGGGAPASPPQAGAAPSAMGAPNGSGELAGGAAVGVAAGAAACVSPSSVSSSSSKTPLATFFEQQANGGGEPGAGSGALSARTPPPSGAAHPRTSDISQGSLGHDSGALEALVASDDSGSQGASFTPLTAHWAAMAAPQQ